MEAAGLWGRNGIRRVLAGKPQSSVKKKQWNPVFPSDCKIILKQNKTHTHTKPKDLTVKILKAFTYIIKSYVNYMLVKSLIIFHVLISIFYCLSKAIACLVIYQLTIKQKLKKPPIFIPLFTLCHAL